MKASFLALTLGSILSVGVNAAGYPPVHIANSTDSAINFVVSYAACAGEDGTIAKGETYDSPHPRGLCLITGVDALVLEDGGSKAVTAEAYVSSGTSYSQFAVIKDGPKYKVVRFVN